MLRNTFCHIPGIGPKRERRLWSSGFRFWEDCSRALPLPLPAEAVDRFLEHLDASRAHLEGNDPGFFARSMPQVLQWRLFPEFRHEIAYLDIETTGLGGWESSVTTIALYDGTSVHCYVQGQNLQDFLDDVDRYKILVTYNGKCFDLPFLQRCFGIRLPQVHVDLRYVLRSLGFGGGLKRCERQLGIDRGDLDGVDGYFAVLLWEEYARRADSKALETLLAYNIQDVVNLETLLVMAYNLNAQETPFAESHLLPLPLQPEIPYQPDRETIERIKARLYLPYPQGFH